jgi:hypothetical protein
MDDEIFDDLVTAISEDFSEEELRDTHKMRGTLNKLLEVTAGECDSLIRAALAIKLVREEVTPFWKRLLNFH